MSTDLFPMITEKNLNVNGIRNGLLHINSILKPLI